MNLYINDRLRTRNVKFFNKTSLDLRYDSVASAFSLDLYFNPDNNELKELACIGHYHIARIEHNGETLLTGYILSEAFNDSPTTQLASIGGYSKSGVIEDCQIPPSLYPLQSDGLTLKQIAQKLISKFDFKMVVDSSVDGLMNEVIDETTANDSQTIKSYLTQLCAQKNIIISHTPEGNLLFTRAKTKQKPIVYFQKGEPGYTSMSLSFNGQAMHSEITVIKDAGEDEEDNAGQSTITNPFVPYVYRPKVIVQSSGNDIDTDKAARNALSDELQNLVLTIVVPNWTLNGKVIRPNSIVSVLNPDVYIFNKVDFFVRNVVFTGDEKNEVATLHCVLPQCYNNDPVKYIFAGINLH